MRPPNLCRSRSAFSLVELLVVIAVLSILAAIVLFSLVGATDDSRESTLRMNLRLMRLQLQLYTEQHANVRPTLAAFADQMTKSSNIKGETAAPGTPGFPYGPYLRSMPVNPANGLDNVGDGEIGTSAWYYDQSTGRFLANDSAAARDY